ncbi:unnamed protein product, partial [Effrenium voratum]
MTSTLELVEKLKAQLVESRADLCKERSEPSLEVDFAKSLSKDGLDKQGFASAGSESDSSTRRCEPPSRDLQDELASLREEFRHHSSSLTAKLTSLASSTRGLSQQLIVEREQRLAFQQEIRERQDRVSVPSFQQGSESMEDSLMSLRQDFDALVKQFQLLQRELEASVGAVTSHLSSVTHWVQEKMMNNDLRSEAHAARPVSFSQDSSTGACLSPILEVSEDHCEETPRSKEAESHPELLQFLQAMSQEMFLLVKQMAERTQVVLTRVDHEKAERLAREAQVAEVLKLLSNRVDGLRRE